MSQSYVAMIDPRAAVADPAQLGAGTKVGAGAYIGANVRMATNVVIGPNVTFVDSSDTAGQTIVETAVVVGAGSVIYAGVVLAAGALVRPGTVVTRSVPAAAIVEGSPAVIVGYVSTESSDIRISAAAPGRNGAQAETTPVTGVTIHHFPVIPDLRGNLTVGEFEKQIPFIPRRYFMVFGVPNTEVRGEHAHHECHQFLICVRGSCSVVADDGNKRVEVVLSAPEQGLYLPPMTWGIQYKYSSDALLLVFASHHYESTDYIRDYSEFIALTNSKV